MHWVRDVPRHCWHYRLAMTGTNTTIYGITPKCLLWSVKVFEFFKFSIIVFFFNISHEFLGGRRVILVEMIRVILYRGRLCYFVWYLLTHSLTGRFIKARIRSISTFKILGFYRFEAITQNVSLPIESLNPLDSPTFYLSICILHTLSSFGYAIFTPRDDVLLICILYDISTVSHVSSALTTARYTSRSRSETPIKSRDVGHLLEISTFHRK